MIFKTMIFGGRGVRLQLNVYYKKGDGTFFAMQKVAVTRFKGGHKGGHGKFNKIYFGPANFQFFSPLPIVNDRSLSSSVVLF